MKKTLFLIFAVLVIFMSAVSFAAEFEDKLILPDFTDERFVLLGNRAPFGYCNDNQNQPVFIEIYIELNANGSKENAFAAFFKSNINDYPFIISMWKSNGSLFRGVVYLDAEEDGVFEVIARMGTPEAKNIVCRNYPAGEKR